MSRFDRYVFAECLGPLGIGFLATTVLLLTNSFFDLAEAMIQRDVPISAALKLLALNLPHIVVVTIPMALLFGILVAIGRLSSDSELTAMRASGVSLLYLYRPILTLSLLLTLINGALMIAVVPWGNRTLNRMTIELFLKGNQSRSIEPRVFNKMLGDKTVYVFDIPPDQERWQGVFLADAVPLGEFGFKVAQSGSVRIGDEGRRLVVELEDSLDQTLDLKRPEEAKIISNRHQLFVLEEETPLGATRTASRGLRGLTLDELKVVVENPEARPELRNRARVEIHKKFALPAICAVFGLLALPLGFSRRGGGKASAFLQALAVVVVYHVLQSVGEEAAAKGHLRPWLAMWMPNLILTLVGAFLLTRRSEDKSLLWTSIDRWLRHASWRNPFGRVEKKRRRHSRLATRPRQPQRRFVLHLPHFTIRFPSRMDRYVLTLFTQVGGIVVAVCISLYIVIDLAGLAEHILTNGASVALLFEYYFYYSLQIFYTVAPMTVLLTTLIVFGLLSRSNEITAAKASGMSLYRLAVPAVAAGLLVVGATAGLDLTVLPAANARQVELRASIKGNSMAEGRRRISRQWYFSQADDGGSFIYNYLLRTENPPSLRRFQAFRFDAEHRLTGHLFAQDLRRDGDRWLMRDGWLRSFQGDRVTRYQRIEDSQPVDLAEAPDFFAREIKSSQEMNLWELRDYVKRLQASGQKVPRLEMQVYNKIAMPVVCLVMVLVALPFAFRLGRQGALSGIGIAIMVGVVLFAVLAIFSTLGETQTIPTLVAAWSPNLLFSLLSMYLFLGVRS